MRNVSRWVAFFVYNSRKTWLNSQILYRKMAFFDSKIQIKSFALYTTRESGIRCYMKFNVMDPQTWVDAETEGVKSGYFSHRYYILSKNFFKN